MAAERDYAGSGFVRRGLALLGLLVVAVVVVACAAGLDKATVRDRQELATATFGLPLDWVEQDQTFLDPPFPYDAEFKTPRSYPTTVEPIPLLIDVAGVLAVELLVLGVVALVRRRNRPGW